jgi:hypothetical protein
MTEDEIHVELETLRAENRYLRYQLDSAAEEAIRLRHKLEHIYALSQLALHSGAGDGAGEVGAADAQAEDH